MKSARERAEDAWKALPASAQVAIDLNYRRVRTGPNLEGSGKKKWLEDVTLSFMEHARDQRHACAEVVSALDAEHHSLSGTARVQTEDAYAAVRSDAHSAVSNAPAPGE